MNDDLRWDQIHKKLIHEDQGHSKYAEEKELLFPQKSVVVDLGGGTGSDAVYFLKKGHSVVLLDVSDFALNEAIRRAKEAGTEKRLVTHKVDFGSENLPLKEGSCDIIYSRIALNYFPRERTVGIFHEIYKSLKSGGRAYITLKSPRDHQEVRFLESSSTIFEPYVFIQNGQLRSRFPESELKKMLDAAEIKFYQVNPYDEDNSRKGKEHAQILNLTEIIISKD